jgi:5-methylcytosine-specific restriction protein B
MKEDAFRDWLARRGQQPGSIGSRVSNLKRVEAALGDLHALARQTDREGFLAPFAYSREDAREGRPNPAPFAIDGDVYNGLATIRQALGLYWDFVQDTGQMPDKALHQALIDRLTRQEIEWAMDRCDARGLQEFLAEWKFGSPRVWALRDGQRYPAKAIVAAAVSRLPEGVRFTAKTFFDGFGEAQSFARLEDLGYALDRGDDGPSTQSTSRLTRDAVEAAMDAYDRWQEAGEHDDVFSNFGAPKDYWVRSTRQRLNRVYPTKPIVGYALNKTSLNGGWGQKFSAARLLHNSGFIIVGEKDQPVAPPSNNYGNLLEGAERVRYCALNYFILPARERGEASVSIRAGDLAGDLLLGARMRNVCQALKGPKFQELAKVPPPIQQGVDDSTTTVFTYNLNDKEQAVAMTEITGTAKPKATNLILYGPPGTGKTYETAREAVRLCLGDDAAAPLRDDRKALMAEYGRLQDEGRVAFVTFHQSISYEEFVEGLRPETQGVGDQEPAAEGAPAAGFRLKVDDGIFKRFSERARLDAGETGRAYRLDRSRPIFKIALGRRFQEEDRIRDALDASEIRHGWGGNFDWSDECFDHGAAIRCEVERQSGNDVSPYAGELVITYSFRSDMQIDDYVVVSDGRDRLRAFGRIVSDYFFQSGADHHPHRRKVEWLWRDDEGADRAKFYPNGFRQHTVYKLNSDLVDWDGLEEIVFGIDRSAPTEGARPYVLIIDEINRANISKVFGELITLLEPDKRLGQANEIRLTLPYSKKTFGVPSNLHIIGTMNTADRSIALLDTALRRRFRFRELMPRPDLLSKNVEGIDLQKLLARLNERIEYLFDREHQIGHAYFIGCQTRADVEAVMRDAVIPLLTEYFYEDWSKIWMVLEGSAVPESGDPSGRFLDGRRLVPPGFDDGTEDGFGRIRWSVRSTFDFSEFAPR